MIGQHEKHVTRLCTKKKQQVGQSAKVRYTKMYKAKNSHSPLFMREGMIFK